MSTLKENNTFVIIICQSLVIVLVEHLSHTFNKQNFYVKRN